MKKAATPAEMTAPTQGKHITQPVSFGHCPQFNGCSAPACPLDPHRHARSYLPSEPICLYMREWIKPQGQERVSFAIGPEPAHAVGEACQDAELTHGPLWKRLSRAKATRSRLEVSMRFLIEVEQTTVTPVVVEADSRSEAMSKLEVPAFVNASQVSVGDSAPEPFLIRSIRELEG